MTDSKSAMLAYLKSGAHRRPWTPDGEPITLGPKAFVSKWHARDYCRKLMARTISGQELVGDDALILTDLVKHYPYYKTHIEPYGIIGFTVKDHPAANGQFVKILVVLLAAVEGRHPRTRFKTCDVSIDRCLNTKREMSHTPNVTTKSVYRQDDVDWVIAA